MTVNARRYGRGRASRAWLLRERKEQLIGRRRERGAWPALFDGLLTCAPVGFALLDLELRFLRVNPTFASSSGRPAGEHVGKTLGEVIPHIDKTLAPMLRHVLATGRPTRGVVQGEPAGLPGKHAQWLASCFAVRTTSGRVCAVGIVGIDITEQKRAEDALRRDAALRERFMAIVSHDIRNPLWSIELTAATLLRLGDLSDAPAEGLRRILSSSGRIERMVSDLIDLTRKHVGNELPTAPRPSDLHEICRQAIEELENLNPGRTVVLRSEGDCRGVWDPDRLGQLVSNLVDNALSYSPARTPVSVGLRGQRCTVVLEVNNLGPPIPDDAMASLFDPFHRGTRTADARQPTRGIGLGLFIAQQIVHAHRGSIRVVSDACTGTTFKVKLPRRRSARGPARSKLFAA